MIDSLDTFAKKARSSDTLVKEHGGLIRTAKTWGEYLGIPFVMSNPREAYKIDIRTGKHHGNLPYEIFNHLGSYMHAIFDTTFENGTMQGAAYASMSSLMEAYNGCERVLDTPLPLAYNIVISVST